jgi:simple sugar transport system permease protein
MVEIKENGFTLKGFLGQIQMPTIIIGGFWILILIAGVVQGLSLASLLGDTIRRFGMWGLLVLAMVPSIQSGTGPNFALPIGVCCG